MSVSAGEKSEASTYHVQEGLTHETLQETMTLVSCCGQSKWVVVSGERRELGPVIHVSDFCGEKLLTLADDSLPLIFHRCGSCCLSGVKPLAPCSPNKSLNTHGCPKEKKCMGN